MTAAQEIWVATALLHYENPGRRDFSVPEIVGRALAENPAAGLRSILFSCAFTHCVATNPPNGSRCCLLTATRNDRRRLFRDGDSFHDNRLASKIHPRKSELPFCYQFLVDWYDHEYARRYFPVSAGRPARVAGAA